MNVDAGAAPSAGRASGCRGEPRTSSDEHLCGLMEAIGEDRDCAAFTELFQHLAPRVRRLLLRRGASLALAEDMMQETMLAVWRHAATFDRRRASVLTWVLTIARNKHLDLLRTAKRSNRAGPELANPQVSADPPSVEEILSFRQSGRILRDAISTLPWEQGEALRQAFYEAKSHREIAVEQTLPLGTVKSRIRLALGQLRTRLPMAQLR